MSLEVDVLTLFPGYLDWLRESRPVRNVVESGELALRAVDLRPFGLLTTQWTPPVRSPGSSTRSSTAR